MKLTEIKIKNTKPRDKKFKLYDGDYLYLIIQPSGIKRWIYTYKNRKEFPIGNYPTISLKEARTKKDIIKKEIILYGLDNYIEKYKNEKNKDKITFYKIVDKWLNKYKNEKSLNTYKSTLLRTEKYILPTLKNRDIKEIKIQDIYSILKKANRPTAEKLKSILNGIFKYALLEQLIDRNIMNDIDISHIHKAKEKNHYPFILELDEIKIYLEEIKNKKTISSLAVYFLWYSSIRQGSVRLIKWEHIKDDYILIPKENSKIKDFDFKLPLTKELKYIIKELETIRTSEYLFYSSTNLNKAISETSIRKIHQNISKKFNISYQSLHGIRHTFSTLTRKYLQKPHNIDDKAIELSLQHIEGSIRENYNHYDYFDKRMELLNLWSDFLNTL